MTVQRYVFFLKLAIYL